MKTVQQSDIDVFTAIAHPVRRQLLDLLAQGDLSVNQLAAHFKISRPAVSQHLKVLIDVGLVTEERKGRERIYQLHIEPLQMLDRWLMTYRQLWQARLNRLDAYLQTLQREESHDDE